MSDLGLADFLAKLPRDSMQSDFVKSEGRHFLPQLAKLPEGDDRSIVMKIHGIPTPFFQLGTAMGLEGAPGFVVDMVLDPWLYLGGFGALTKAGRAGKATRGLLGARRAAAMANEGIQGAGKALIEDLAAKNLPREAILEELEKTATHAARMDTRSHVEVSRRIRNAKTDREALSILDEIEESHRKSVFEALGTPVRGTSAETKAIETTREAIPAAEKAVAESRAALEKARSTMKAPAGARRSAAEAIGSLGRGIGEAQPPPLSGVRTQAVSAPSKAEVTKAKAAARKAEKAHAEAKKKLETALGTADEAAAKKAEKEAAEAAEKAKLEADELKAADEAAEKAQKDFEAAKAAPPPSGGGEVPVAARATMLDKVQQIRGLEAELSAAEKALEAAKAAEQAAIAAEQAAISGRAEDLAKALPGRETPLEFKAPAMFQRIRAALNDGMLREGKQGLGQGGLRKARAHLQKEVMNRQALRREAQKLREVGDVTGFRRLAKNITKLDPSPAIQTIFNANRRNVEAAVDLALRERRLAPPLARGAREQAVAGQRSLLTLRVPFTNVERTLVKGVEVIGGAEKFGRKLGIRPGRLRRAGLVAGATVAGAKMARLLGTPRPTASYATARDAIAHAALASREVYEDVSRFKGAHEAWTAAIYRGRFLASNAAEELRAAMWNHGIKTSEEVYGVVQLIEEQDVLVSKLQGDDLALGELTQLAKDRGFTEAQLLFADMISTELKAVQNTLREQGVVESFRENYFPRAVAKVLKPDEYQSAVSGMAAKTSTFYKHGQQRLIEDLDTLLELEKKGVVEVEKDVPRLIGAYFGEAARASANKRLLQDLANVRFEVPEAPGIGKVAEELAEERGGIPLFVEAESREAAVFGSKYLKVDDPWVVSMAKRVGMELGFGGVRQPELGRSGTVLVHKDVARQVRNVLAPARSPPKELETILEKLFEATLALGAVAKRGLLSWSFFHHMALTESAIATLGHEFLRVSADFAKRIFEPGSDALKETVGKTVLRGRHSFYESGSTIETALRHGMTLGPLVDADVDVFQKAMKWAERTVPILSPATRALGRFEMAWNRGLWDYYHNALKLHAWDTLYTQALARHPNIPAKQAARGAAEHVNNAFGGLAWENFWASRQGLRFSRLFWLAPDWTLSNIRIATDIFANWFKRGELGRKALGTMGGRTPFSNQDLFRADVRAVFARQYALRSGLIFAVGANFLNLAFTGHFMDENPEGYRTQVMLPWKDERGRSLFLRFGKQFREPFEFLTAPIETLRKKASAPANVFITQYTGRDFFGRPIITTEDGPVQNLLKRSGLVGLNFVPISIQAAAGIGGRAQSISAAILGSVGLPVRTERVRERVDADGRETSARMAELDFQDAGIEIPEAMQGILEEQLRDGTMARQQDLSLSATR